MNALRYAVRIPCVLKYFGLLCLPLAVLTIPPMGMAFLSGDATAGIRYAGVAVAVALLGWTLSRIPAADTIQTNEAMTISAMIFLVASLVMVWPVMSTGMPFTDAWFETISGFTTTGLTTAGDPHGLPAGHLFARAWMQWIGGLGIVVLSLGVMIHPGAAAKRIGDLEDYEENLIGGAKANAMRVLKVYSVMTLVAIGLLGLLEADWFSAVAYGLASVSTGGFSPRSGSLSGLTNPWSQLVVIGTAMSGAVALLLYNDVFKKRLRPLLKDYQLRGLIVFGGLGTAALMGILHAGGYSWFKALHHGFLNALSAQTTAGFSSIDIAGLSPAAKLNLIFGMMIGGGIGSTAGGIKILRVLIVLRCLQLLLQRTGMPRQALIDLRLGDRPLGRDEILGAFSLVFVFVAAIALSWLPFLLLGYAPLDSLFEVVSALGTVGLSTGITNEHLNPLLKYVLSADMLLGRLEIIAWLVFLHPGTWLGRRKET